MIGQGVLHECLLDPEVRLIKTIGRTATGTRDPKLREIVHRDFSDFGSLERELAGLDACFFCLGVSSNGLSEAEYERVTYGFTLAAATALARLNPGMTFIYVSGLGADSSERGSIMWARVRGKTENALLRLPFRGVYVFRPGFVQPLHGARSRTALYRFFYAITGPALPLLRRMFPAWVLTTEEMGRAMLAVARRGAPKRVLESRDIKAVALSAPA
jgi:uncharacterized protein YbjT (DUF2867 family)